MRRKRQSEAEEEALQHSFTAHALDELVMRAQEEAWGIQGRTGQSEEAASQCSELPSDAKGAEVSKGSEYSQSFHRRIHEVLSALFCSTQRALQVREVGKAISDVMLISQDEALLCRPQPKAGKMDLFPLPAADVTGDPEDPFFFKALAFGLNSLTGLRVSYAGAVTRTANRVLKRLKGIVESSCILVEPLPHLDFKDFFATRSVDYSGDEVKLARELTWESIEPSLPQEVGQLHLRDFCQDGVLHYVDNFEDFFGSCGRAVGWKSSQSNGP